MAILEQIIPSEYCATCDVCCRFLDDETPLAPVFPGNEEALIPYRERLAQPLHAGAGFICRNFDPAANRCRNYGQRPIDCQLYPYVIMYEHDYKHVVLGLDPKCPYVKGQGSGVKGQGAEVARSIEKASKDIDPQYIARFQDDVVVIKRLNAISKAAEQQPVLRKLLISDRPFFERYAAKTERPLASHSFAYHYIWSDLLDYRWAVIDGRFCLFCKSGAGIFMPVPPLGGSIDARILKKCFSLMNSQNADRRCSRIEDIARDDVRSFKGAGYTIQEKGCEYICERTDVAALAGDTYKAKRALCNYFERHYQFCYREFKRTDRAGCLKLYETWGSERSEAHADTYYRALLEDAYHAHRRAVARHEGLGLIGRVVEVNGRLAAYTFGYPLDQKVFVILFEIADVSIKGLAQYIFREFCKELDAFSQINLMDDSGLENLKKAKMSYHPVRIERVWAAYA